MGFLLLDFYAIRTSYDSSDCWCYRNTESKNISMSSSLYLMKSSNSDPFSPSFCRVFCTLSSLNAVEAS